MIMPFVLKQIASHCCAVVVSSANKRPLRSNFSRQINQSAKCGSLDFVLSASSSSWGVGGGGGVVRHAVSKSVSQTDSHRVQSWTNPCHNDIICCAIVIFIIISRISPVGSFFTYIYISHLSVQSSVVFWKRYSVCWWYRLRIWNTYIREAVAKNEMMY